MPTKFRQILWTAWKQAEERSQLHQDSMLGIKAKCTINYITFRLFRR